jgi:hypothetical protein
MEGNDYDLICGTVSAVVWKNFENPKSLNQDRRSSGRDLNPVRPEYEAGMLTTQLRPLFHLPTSCHCITCY